MLTRAEACQLLWQRQHPATQGVAPPVPDYFADREAAATLALWVKTQSLDVRENFQQHFAEIVSDGADSWSVRFFDALLATPEQITLAACRTLGFHLA